MTTPIKKLMLAAFAATAICLGAKADTIDLSLLTANYTAQDGDVLTGETSCLVTIADGAIVTLAGVTINRLDAQPSMTCVGNATVLLADGTMNVLNGTLQVSPSGKTFTLRGTTGSLTVTASHAAGIGGQHDGGNRGSIVIEGGVITATGNDYGAGIGGGGGTYGCCESITISGGTIVATGGANAVGIGYSGWSKGGFISITGGTVDAIGNGGFPAIGTKGTGYDQCGNIIIAKTIKRVRATSTASNKIYSNKGTVSIAESLQQTTDGNTLTIAALWNGEGTGTENDPYIVTDAEDIALVLAIGSGSIYMRLPDGGVAIEGSVVVPLSTTAVNIDLNGGSIAGATGEPAILLLGNTEFTATGTGTISADEGIEAVKRQGSITASSGVTITGIGGGGSVPAPAFAAGGASEIVKFAQAEGGKWTITAFAEMSNESRGTDVTDSQIKVYSADTLEELKNATIPVAGATVKETKSAVKTVVEVPAPSGKDSQFFRVDFGE